ncbi:MAG: hypothetical protein NUV50_13530 [Rhodospirillales bacterium]|nr:hypothetical protein [Rhodospirillales bacterium]
MMNFIAQFPYANVLAKAPDDQIGFQPERARPCPSVSKVVPDSDKGIFMIIFQTLMIKKWSQGQRLSGVIIAL